MNQQEESGSSPKGQDQVSARLFPYQMKDVRVRRILAELCEPDEDEEMEPSTELLLLAEEEPDAAEFTLGLLFQVEHMGVRDSVFDLIIALEGDFEAIVEPETIDREVAEQFRTQDVVSLLWPYLREVVQDITSRMGLDMPPLPIVDARRLVFTPSSQEEETAE